MINPSGDLTEIREALEKTLLDAGFSLQQFSIEIEEDSNHMAHLKVVIHPHLLKDPEEKQVDDAFNHIVKGLE